MSSFDLGRLRERVEQNVCLSSNDADEPARVSPPATDEQIAAMRAALGGALPDDLERVMRVTTELWGEGVQLTFDALCVREPLLGWGGRTLEIGGDGAGNYDYLEPNGATSRVWWVSHDPPEIVLAARSLEELLARRVAYAEASTRYWRGDEHEPSDPDRSPTYATPQARDGALADERDASARDFLAGLPARARVFDLRGAPAGTGIDLTPLRGALHRAGEIVAWVPDSRLDRAIRESEVEQKLAEDAAWLEARKAAAKKPWWKLW